MLFSMKTNYDSKSKRWTIVAMTFEFTCEKLELIMRKRKKLLEEMQQFPFPALPSTSGMHDIWQCNGWERLVKFME